MNACALSMERRMEIIWRRVARAFWFTLAVVFLIESWLWDNVRVWLRELALALGVERIAEWIAATVRELSPWATLTVFIVPALLILTLKMYAVAELARGHVVYGIFVILAANALGLGVTAFLFDICRAKLLQMAWFARLYELVLRARGWAHDLVEPVRSRLYAMRVVVKAIVAEMIGRGGSPFLRKLRRIRLVTRRGGKA